jgi:hypothetical protein
MHLWYALLTRTCHMVFLLTHGVISTVTGQPLACCLMLSIMIEAQSEKMDRPPFNGGNYLLFVPSRHLYRNTPLSIVIESPTTPRYQFPHTHCYILYLCTYLSCLSPTSAAGNSTRHRATVVCRVRDARESFQQGFTSRPPSNGLRSIGGKPTTELTSHIGHKWPES